MACVVITLPLISSSFSITSLLMVTSACDDLSNGFSNNLVIVVYSIVIFVPINNSFAIFLYALRYAFLLEPMNQSLPMSKSCCVSPNNKHPLVCSSVLPVCISMSEKFGTFCTCNIP